MAAKKFFTVEEALHELLEQHKHTYGGDLRETNPALVSMCEELFEMGLVDDVCSCEVAPWLCPIHAIKE